MTRSIPRPEHPRPQRRRDEWQVLNGEWEFEIDPGRSGRERGLPSAGSLDERITVPFPPESRLSGIGHADFMPAVWYRRTFEVPGSWLDGRLHLRFEAVDYETEVWINGESVGKHRGGYSPFVLDITDAARSGTNVVTVCAEDDVRSDRQPSGKQSRTYDSEKVLYSRVTGIWQPVWLEPVPSTRVRSFRLDTDPVDGTIRGEVNTEGTPTDCALVVRASIDDDRVGRTTVQIQGSPTRFDLDLEETRPWTPETPALYDLDLSIRRDGHRIDAVGSYVGLRSLGLSDGTLYLNGDPIFQRLVLDQGYYPDGLYTAPSDEALARDIEIAKEMGFNGARLHEKVFEPRFLYHADRLGYLVWGEYADWGLDRTAPWALGQMLPEWLDVLERDYNHPSIVGWTPFNETPADRDPDLLRGVYRATKAVDPTRPVIDSSGYHHVETDVLDIHDYDDDPASFRDRYERIQAGETISHWSSDAEAHGPDLSYVSEYGGTGWNPDEEEGWAHGSRPESKAAFLDRYQGLTEALLENPAIGAFCYTQLYDIEQEVNGLYTADREPKFDPETIRDINEQIAAVERE